MKQNQITIQQVSNTFLTLHAHLNELEQVFTQDIFIGIEPWVFPEDNYTVLAIWLLYDPVAHELFPVNKKKSWAELAERLSKFQNKAYLTAGASHNFLTNNYQNYGNNQSNLPCEGKSIRWH